MTMFPYYGRKGKIANRFPPPTRDLVVEPFAGSAAYVLYYRPGRALCIERDERLVELWHRLSHLPPENPTPPKLKSKTNDLLVKLASYSENASFTRSPLTVTSRMVRDWHHIHNRARVMAPYVRNHVEYRQGDYREAPDVEATWFIDPPYQVGIGRRGYRYGASLLDFRELAEFVLSRRGGVIVCEQAGADWLPFEPLVTTQSHGGVFTTEVVWMNDEARQSGQQALDLGGVA